MNAYRLSYFLAGALCLTGCASSDNAVQSLGTYCEDPRPQVCTMIYAPVCGMADDGSRKTYASDCTACSKASVVGHDEGECRD